MLQVWHFFHREQVTVAFALDLEYFTVATRADFLQLLVVSRWIQLLNLDRLPHNVVYFLIWSQTLYAFDFLRYGHIDAD